MKEVTIHGKVYQYMTICEVSEHGDYYRTEFYDGTVEVEYRKYWLFGPKLKKHVPNLAFKIYANSRDLGLSKEWWAKEIENQISLLDRALEIKNGILI